MVYRQGIQPLICTDGTAIEPGETENSLKNNLVQCHQATGKQAYNIRETEGKQLPDKAGKSRI